MGRVAGWMAGWIDYRGRKSSVGDHSTACGCRDQPHAVCDACLPYPLLLVPSYGTVHTTLTEFIDAITLLECLLTDGSASAALLQAV